MSGDFNSDFNGDFSGGSSETVINVPAKQLTLSLVAPEVFADTLIIVSALALTTTLGSIDILTDTAILPLAKALTITSPTLEVIAAISGSPDFNSDFNTDFSNSTSNKTIIQVAAKRLTLNASTISAGAGAKVDVAAKALTLTTSPPAVIVKVIQTIDVAAKGLTLTPTPPSVLANLDILVSAKRLTLHTAQPTLYEITVVKWTGGSVPLEHVEDSKELEADAYTELFEFLLSDQVTKIYLKLDRDETWQGNKYEGTGIQLTGVSQYSDEQVSRPQMRIFNPLGVYSPLVNDGLLDNCIVTRIRLLRSHLEQDLAIFRKQSWRVNRIVNLTNQEIKLELREMLDGQHFLTPARMFIPPDFPTVSL